MGYRLRKGMNVVADEEQGWRLILEAAMAGHPVAMAACYSEGRGCPKNSKKSFALFFESAERGHPNGKPVHLVLTSLSSCQL